MRWDDFRQSENVEDRTGDGPLAGPGFPLPTGSGGMGIPGPRFTGAVEGPEAGAAGRGRGRGAGN